MKPAIFAQSLSKTFYSPIKTRGFAAHIKNLLRPRYQEVDAVSDISFTIQPGERVALIGPNGSGKSSTIKMMTGIFAPSKGSVEIFGVDPYRNRKDCAKNIGTLFGQRSQLWQHLPAERSFDVLRVIYNIEFAAYKKRVGSLIEELEMEDFIDRPIKQLSLGQRMRCEIAASLIHDPKILFLDEPTIGLDVISKNKIRQHILQRAQDMGTTIFLTSHDTSDIEAVAQRVIMINNGKVVCDRTAKELVKMTSSEKWIKIECNEDFSWKHIDGIRLIRKEGNQFTFSLHAAAVMLKPVLQEISNNSLITNFSVGDPPLEEIIIQLYNKK